MADILGDLRERGVFAYANDITIAASTFEESLELLEELLKRLRENGFVINHKKV